MGFGSLWHWAIVLIVVLIFFGRGRISEIMGDFGSGIKNFKQGMDDDGPQSAPPPVRIAASETVASPASTETPAGASRD
ncbi:twin-arginine translocase TatA/TatE family subunit [Novosphingobium sp. G106]|uniref:twin-arginine translocase TatA/TatE family subunit n=1 Tax=Novosphingobium sp. G106 TaxID=2849500 RepID=UPI001C2CEDEF|nr:twin-arginine translocase TatA/TatE family subunit [Novosphingobium sp. G106]MBV1692269.1 twin-arginine translocase TatA/TatE family subunit [Novosphingobium sp. G106]